MNRLLIILIALIPIVSAISDAEWEAYKAEHGKVYSSRVEDAMRRKLLEEHIEFIDSLNRMDSPKKSFKLGLNHLSDMTDDERKSMLGFKANHELRKKLRASQDSTQFIESILQDNNEIPPEEVDWRKVDGVVTPVKNQKHCGSCWAFSTTGALEGYERNFNINLTGLSEQNLVDCSNDNGGCNGGDMALAFLFVRKQGGINDDQTYQYTAKEGKCKFNKDNVVITDSGAVMLSPGDEELLKRVVAKIGPVSVAIAAGDKTFSSYQEGVYDNKNCGTDLDHAVLVVGYGVDPKGGPYWLVKNSWSSKWGENGYIRMSRNKDNQCGIALEATLPVFY